MANMKYCMFENTFKDLKDCYEDMQWGRDISELSETEKEYRKKLIALSKKIASFDEDNEDDDGDE